LLIDDRPIWKQPEGYHLIAGFFGEMIFFTSTLGIVIYYSTAGTVHPYLICFFIGITIHIVTYFPEQVYYKRGDFYKLKKLHDLINTGCECGSKKFLNGMEDVICYQCNKSLFHSPQIPKKGIAITPKHLNLRYLFSQKVKQFEVSIPVDKPINIVFDYYNSEPRVSEINKYGMYDFVKKNEKEYSYKILGQLYHNKLIYHKYPSKISERITCGSNYAICYYYFRDQGPSTTIKLRMTLSYYDAKGVRIKKLFEGLKFDKIEIEKM